MSLLPQYPPFLLAEANPIRAAKRIRGPRQWKDMCQTNDWLHGIGASLVVGCPRYSVVLPSDAANFSFYIQPHEQNVVRLWVISIIVGARGAKGSFEVNGTPIDTWSVPGVGTIGQTLEFLEVVDTPTDTPGLVTVTLDNDADSPSALLVYHVGCYEMPRRDIEIYTASTIPAENSLAHNQPIYEHSTNQASIDGVCRSAAKARGQCRRAGLFNWSFDDGLEITATADPGGDLGTALEDDGEGNVLAIDIPIQPRSVLGGVSTSVRWTAEAKVSGGDGWVRARSNILSTDLRHITSPTRGASSGLVSCQTEDPSRRAIDGGLRDGIVGRLRITAWCSPGETITLYDLSVGEPKP
jgi:hypothetical protein